MQGIIMSDDKMVMLTCAIPIQYIGVCMGVEWGSVRVS
jgi:hypothetical protein